MDLFQSKIKNTSNSIQETVTSALKGVTTSYASGASFDAAGGLGVISKLRKVRFQAQVIQLNV